MFGDPFAITDGNPGGYGSVLLARIDFARQDEFVPRCVVNAASYEMRRRYGGAPFSIAPGEIVSLFGLGIGPAPVVRIGERQLPVIYSEADQANLSVPYDVPPGGSIVTIERGPYRASYPVEVAGLFPGVFTLDGIHAAAIDQDGTVNSADHPAARGSIVAIYATGLGPLDPLQHTAIVFEVYIEAATPSNASGMEILYAGQAPMLPAGAYQVKRPHPARSQIRRAAVAFRFRTAVVRTFAGIAAHLHRSLSSLAELPALAE